MIQSFPPTPRTTGQLGHRRYGRFGKVLGLSFLLSAAALLGACAGVRTVEPSVGHLTGSADTSAPAPPVVTAPPALKKPVPLPPVATYSVVAKDVPVGDLLFSLARDAELDLDMLSENDGTITINAIDQPLSNILARVVSQAGMRYQLRGTNLVVRNDTP